MTFTLPAFSVLKPYAIGLGIAAVCTYGTVIYKNIERKGAEKILLHAADSTAKLAKDSVAIRSRIAQEAVRVAEQARDRANAQIAAGQRLQAHTDSVAHSAQEARDRANAELSDSSASNNQLRAALGSLVSQSRADSVAAAQQHDLDQRSIMALVLVVQSDSAALHAEQQRSASLVALNASVARQVALLKSAEPSTFGKVLRYTALAAISVEAGRMSAGKLP
jgi:hypothetical protein